MVTIKEVAKKAGVSHGTVSNVINGAMNVSVEKIQRVEKAMFELGYKPNVIARSLKSERTYGINRVLPNIRNYEYVELYENIDRYMKKGAFRAAMRLLNLPDVPEVILCSNSWMANGVEKAADMVFGSSGWGPKHLRYFWKL